MLQRSRCGVRRLLCDRLQGFQRDDVYGLGVGISFALGGATFASVPMGQYLSPAIPWRLTGGVLAR